MNTQDHTQHIHATVNHTTGLVFVELRDRRPEDISLFGELDQAARNELAQDAWTIGMRALLNAHTAAQEAKLRDVGIDLLADVDRRLASHVSTQEKIIGDVLARYFDPSDGQVTQRLDAFVANGGVLADLLQKHLGPQNSTLAETLARAVGESSPILRKLSPTDSEGLVKTLEAQLREVMSQNQSALARALDPLAEDGAIARFLKGLRQELQLAEKGRGEQLAAAVRALDANDENSLLSRLVRETGEARRQVLEAINPEVPASPLGALKSSLTELLKAHTDSMKDWAQQQQERQAAFERDVREVVTRIDSRRSHDKSSPRGGLDFEDAAMGFVAKASQGGPYVFEVTGNSGGLGRCKKGDATIRFTQESAFAGAAVVFEAKRDSTYTVQKALDELDVARKNRNAGVGVFVMARSHAGDSFPHFSRHGNNVLVVWDEEDPATDPALHAAILLGLGLVARTRAQADEGDINAMRDVEHRIESELSRLQRMGKSSDGIRKHVDDLDDEIRKAKKYLDLLLGKAKDTLRALNVELCDEAVDARSPISLPEGSLDRAKSGAGEGEEAA